MFAEEYGKRYKVTVDLNKEVIYVIRYIVLRFACYFWMFRGFDKHKARREL